MRRPVKVAATLATFVVTAGAVATGVVAVQPSDIAWAAPASQNTTVHPDDIAWGWGAHSGLVGTAHDQ